MSNKTSDNVANIERLNNFANMTFLYGNRVNLNVSALKEIQNDIKNILSDYTRQKQINEEHQKINGELRERVKELEEENHIQRKQIMNIFDNDYIAKQAVIDKIEELKDTLKHYNEYSKLNLLEKVNVDLINARIEILQKLLGGDENSGNFKS